MCGFKAHLTNLRIWSNAAHFINWSDVQIGQMHLTWTLFYCLLCIFWNVCCNPAFLAAKSNKGYIIIIIITQDRKIVR